MIDIENASSRKIKEHILEELIEEEYFINKIFDKDELRDEVDGIENWMLAGVERLIQNNYQFTIGKAVTNLKNNYKKEQDLVKIFFEDKLSYCRENKIANKKLMKKFKKLRRVAKLKLKR